MTPGADPTSPPSRWAALPHPRAEGSRSGDADSEDADAGPPAGSGDRGPDRGERYAAQFARLVAQGVDVHGEATLCASLAPVGSRVLDAGCGTGRVAVRLAELGYVCTGVDLDESMLAQARASGIEVTWILADLADLAHVASRPASPPVPAQAQAGETGFSGNPELTGHPGLAEPFDLVLAAGNVIPLLAPGTEEQVIVGLASYLRPGGILVAGFGLDPAHLPLPAAPFGLPEYDAWCGRAGLTLERRLGTWDGAAFDPAGGYAVSIHRRP